MQRTVKKLDTRAALPAIAAVVVVFAIATASWIMLYSNDTVTVEASIHDIDYGNDPIRGLIDVRVTNNGSKDILVELWEVTVWADEGRTVPLVEQSVGGLSIPSKSSVTETYPFAMGNTHALGGTVWVDMHGVYWYGSDRHEVNEVGRPVSVDGGLSRIFG